MTQILFVEYLTLRSWLTAALPQLLAARSKAGRAVFQCVFLDATALGLAAARVIGALYGISTVKIHYRLMDVRDDEGLLLRFRIPSQDLMSLREGILRDKAIEDAVKTDASGYLKCYLAKALTSGDVAEPDGLWRAVQLIQTFAWWVKRQTQTTMIAVVLTNRAWWPALEAYGQRSGIRLVHGPGVWSLRVFLRSMVPVSWVRLLKRLCVRVSFFLRGSDMRRSESMNKKPKIAVEFYGQLNLGSSQLHSDLQFWQQSQSLRQCETIVLFGLPQDPLDAGKLKELQTHGLSGLATLPEAAKGRVPAFAPTLSGIGRKGRDVSENRWVREQVRRYQDTADFWEECFSRQGIKVFVSWFKNTQTHCAIADGMQQAGGVTAMYQRSFDTNPSIEVTTASDVLFGCSLATAEIERRSGSRVPYFVSIGWLGDHRFSLLRPQAQRIRRTLEQAGAKRILGLLDENSRDDERWHTGHVLERENYAFLLEKILREPWLGLVIKPKVPKSLRKRLGPVAELLEKAEATGRCYVFGQGRGALQGAYPPAAAALAVDVMIHGHCNAGAAGLESALAGTPTLLMDRLGWKRSPLYQLGVGRVVFNTWEQVWGACLVHWKQPGGLRGFGDWSAMLSKLDPFQDGKAAERMGDYLSWLIEGFGKGQDRAQVLEEVAERYRDRWGARTVTAILPSQEDRKDPIRTNQEKNREPIALSA